MGLRRQMPNRYLPFNFRKDAITLGYCFCASMLCENFSFQGCAILRSLVLSHIFVMSAFIGSWKLCESQNFDEFLRELGVNFFIRKAASTSKPTVTFDKFGDSGLKMKTETILKTTEQSFTFGEEFDETTIDGRQVKSTVTKDSDTQLTQVQKHCDGNTVIVRKIEGDTMVTTATFKNVTSVRKYQRQ
ncbi:hypothetical protein CRM22_004371 [Opisthorchis felineus]|uniref:Cytosolic fatty-acid binding proteins domain-containing protein n=2 Tax=Opisthorchis felineus TaxID=147828 RepID=A0A4S2LWI4_OPIFE|nr:hypothetical protein CRM22_004371 [Opisthorchis felineus]